VSVEVKCCCGYGELKGSDHMSSSLRCEADGWLHSIGGGNGQSLLAQTRLLKHRSGKSTVEGCGKGNKESVGGRGGGVV
jgi:hypothetical protein